MTPFPHQPEAAPAFLSRAATSFGVSLAITSVINALIVVAKESSKSVMDGMKAITGHHWTTHSALVVLLFFVLGWIFSRANGGQGLRIRARNVLTIVLSGVLLSGLIIVGFYLIGD
jgi:hypothetical protein